MNIVTYFLTILLYYYVCYVFVVLIYSIYQDDEDIISSYVFRNTYVFLNANTIINFLINYSLYLNKYLKSSAIESKFL